MNTKQCSKCLTLKDIAEFNKAKKYKGGIYSRCRDCCKLYYQENKEIAKAQRKVRYYKNQDRAKKESRNWYHSNKERAAESRKKWLENNRGKANAIKKKYKLAKLSAMPSWLTELDELIINEYYERAAKMSNDLIKFHVDHIVPLQGTNVSGLHVPWNLQVLEASKNISKSNKLWLVYTP